MSVTDRHRDRKEGSKMTCHGRKRSRAVAATLTLMLALGSVPVAASAEADVPPVLGGGPARTELYDGASDAVSAETTTDPAITVVEDEGIVVVADDDDAARLPADADHDDGGVTEEDEDPVWQDGDETVAEAQASTTKVAAPAAKSGLVYNAAAQTGVAAGAGYTLSGTTKATDAGTYTAKATPKKGYVWTDGTSAAKAVTWKIAPRALTDKSVAVAAIPTQLQSKTYARPNPTVTYSGAKLTCGRDYTLSYTYANGTDAGSATVRVTGKGNYSGVRDAKFTVAAMDLWVQAHSQGVGWQSWVHGSQVCGTTGQGLRLEAFCVKKTAGFIAGSITYQAHVQGIGWQKAVADGKMAGTTGAGKRVEAIRVQLTGDMAKYFDVAYQVHVQRLGWTAVARNGASCGTEGLGLRLEAIRVALVRKGEAYAPAVDFHSASARACSISYNAKTCAGGQLAACANGAVVSGGALRSVSASIDNGQAPSGGITYAVRPKGSDKWGANKVSGTFADGGGAGIEAVRFTLTGNLSCVYDVWYKAHVAGMGWTQWATNGAPAGSSGFDAAIDGYKAVLVMRGGTAPSNAGSDLDAAHYVANARTRGIEKYVKLATDIAKDNRHGYSQLNRWGQDYDCSTLVIRCLRAAGYDTGKATFTGDMLDLKNRGFSAVRYSGQGALRRGDILLTPNDHTEIYLGESRNVGAIKSELGTIHGTPGDQTGHEIEVIPFNNNSGRGWVWVLRLR